jgi:hypothetical protein
MEADLEEIAEGGEGFLPEVVIRQGSKDSFLSYFERSC